MRDGDSIFGVRPERLDRLLRLGLHEPRESGPPVPPVLTGVAEQPGSRIGRYRLLETIGEGGMGVVYRAEQAEPVRRQVALKIIKPGMDSKRVLARFEAEEQALAMMEHPHIARVYDAGVAPSGRPYFVMELVKGLPISEHCDRQRMTIEQRLHLFLRVCEAVQHAHQKGIIHRDLKPSNILVMIQGQEAVPKVIDFGVARAISQPLTQRTLYTEQGQLIGTPEYMSPEQADAGNQDIDTRTDIYSLGVVLYELLAGVLPFDVDAFRTGGIDHIRKVICEEDPKTPSTRLSKTSEEESTESARRRQTDARTLRHTLRGDLDWITLKAMDKDLARRYATVDAMATDIRNYLNHQPVTAAPPGTLYRARKFARRHRQAIAAAGVAVLLLVTLLWAVQAHVQAGKESFHAQALEHERILADAQRLFDRRGTQAQDTSDPSSEALALLEPLLSSPHVGQKAQLLSATILVEHRYYDDAGSRLEKLLDGPPEIAGAAYALLARTIWEGPSLGPVGVKKAEDYQKKAQELLPRTAEAYYLRAMAALTIHEKLDFLKRALEFAPDHYPSHRLQALTHQASRRYEDLKIDAWIIVNRWSRDPSGYSLRAVACRELGHYQEAVADYNEAIARTAEDSAEYLDLVAQRCETFLRMGDYERVVAEALPVETQHPASLQYHVFCALTALGRYEEASALFGRVLDSEQTPGSRFREWDVGMELKSWSMRYVFDTLEAGRPWHPLDSMPDGPAFLAMFEAEETHRELAAKARPLIQDCFTGHWSPDGTKVVFSLGVLGNSGVAVYDLKTHETDLLIVPGKNPSWSPDGRYIAFVRDRTVLRLSDLTGGGRKYQRRLPPPSDAEVWVMKADGTQPRRLATGADWPSWSADSKHVYYQAGFAAVRSIAVEDSQAQPKLVIPSEFRSHAVSPDGRYIAHTESGSLRITDLVSGSQVAEGLAPMTVWPTDWSPDGREISLGGGLAGDVHAGFWIYDFDKKEAAQVLTRRIGTALWSPDRTRLLISLSEPYSEIWVADLKPGLSTVEALGPARNVEEHCREVIDICTRGLAVDPNLMVSHQERLICALWINDDRVPLYLQEFEHAIDRVPLHPYFCDQLAEVILLDPPPIRDRLGPLALLCARKAAEKESGYARALAPLFLNAGQPEEAAHLWQIGRTTGNFLVNGGFEDGVRRPWETVGQMDIEVVTELRGAAVPEKPIEGKYCLYADVHPDTAYYWSAAVCPIGAVFEAGKKYTISAFLKARKGTLNIDFKPEQNRPGWPEYGEKMMTITDTWAEYYVTTPVFNKDVIPAHFAFNIGEAPGGFWIDDVKFYEGDYVPTVVRK